MREILFRGKRCDNGEWVQGFYVRADHHWHNNGIHKDWIICGASANGGWFALHNKYPVKAESISQFTGLTDKNGKKIFEGDLLNGFEYPFYRSEDNAHNYFAEMVWFDECCAFGIVTHKYPTSNVRGISAGNTDYLEEYDFSEWEVIGNIHDNPELLEGKKDGRSKEM